MITHLSIQGLAIIDSLAIDFSPGFNVITGETGAGKSILIRALNFLMGAKASAEAVRKGFAQASVTGEFSVAKDHAAVDVLERLGIPTEQCDGRYPILIRRLVTAKGRSQSWINDVNVTGAPLREVGATLVDVFGQHENQRLMDPARHVTYLDDFLTEKGVREKVGELSRECMRLLRELTVTIEAFSAGSRGRDYLDFRLEELRNFAPSVEDHAKIQDFCRQADRVVGLRDTLVRALNCLEGGDGENVNKAVWETSRLLSTVQPTNEEGGAENAPQIETLRERAGQIATDLDDFSYELGKLVSAFDFDEAEVETAQSRLYGYQDLFRKHAVRDIDGLVAETTRLETELGFLENAAAQVAEGLATLYEKTIRLGEAARKLTKARGVSAKTIKKAVEAELQELAMPGSKLDIEFLPARRSMPSLDLQAFGEPLVKQWQEIAETLETISDEGAERGQFLLASNPGEPFLPLTRIASGGELSRIMLALKKALTADAETCVLVFDEVDTGISGRVADVVGRKMRDLAGDFQVICVSHLPQVAVYADTHFLVKKAGKANRTESSIIKLTSDESAKEIARLLSGAEVSTPSLANAKSLIERARGKKGKAAASHARA